MQKLNVGIINAKEGTEYSGHVEIHDENNAILLKCDYFLTNAENTKTINGTFEKQKNEATFAGIIKELNLIVNNTP